MKFTLFQRNKTIISVILTIVSITINGQELTKLSVAERNAQLGFSDTINRLADDFIKTSLIVADPGDQTLFSVFGHAAIRLQCPTFGLDYCFSYESENLNKDLLKFLTGEMQMGMMAFPLDEYLKIDSRAISEYSMNIPPHAEIMLWKILDQHLLEEYCIQYNYIDKACAYMNIVMLDEMDSVVEDIEIRYQKFPDKLEEMTIGDILCNESKQASWTKFWISTICYGKNVINPNIPIKKKVMYPDQLVYTLQHAEINGTPILSTNKIVHATAPQMKDTWCKPIYIAWVLLLLIICSMFWRKPYIDWLVLLLQFGFTALIMFLVIFSNMPYTEWNYMIILYNPLPLLFWKWRKYWAMPYVMILLLWVVIVCCWPHYIVDSAHLIFTVGFCLILVKQWVEGKYSQSQTLRFDWHNPLGINVALFFAGGWELLKLKIASFAPSTTSSRTLRRILEEAKDTQYGKEHHFKEILENSHTDKDLYALYQKHVPANSYEMLKPYVDRHRQGEETILFNGKPAIYTTTSGTTAAPKWIPITEDYIKNVCEKMSRLWFYIYTKHKPWVFTGVNMSIVGKTIEGYAEDGTICGSISGITQKRTPSFLKHCHAIPLIVNDISDYTAKYYTLIRLAIERNITSIITPNPSTIVELQNMVDNHFVQIQEDIRYGTISSDFKIEYDIRQKIETNLRPNPERADELGLLLEKYGRLLPKYYWPNLQVVNTWKCGNTMMYAKKLEDYLLPQTKHLEFGYFASECRFGLVLDETNNTVLFPHMHYYEFVEEADLGNPNPRFYQLDEIEEGKHYCPYITTISGLYRYNMNDLLEVGPKYWNAPTVRVLRKTNGFTNITGEKLHEQQLMLAVKSVENKYNTNINFYVAFAVVEESRYHIMLEFDSIHNTDIAQITKDLDEYLCCVNIEYRSKRQSNRLKKIVVHILVKDAFNKFKQLSIANGKRDGQFKMNLLTQDKEQYQLFLLLENNGI